MKNIQFIDYTVVKCLSDGFTDRWFPKSWIYRAWIFSQKWIVLFTFTVHKNNKNYQTTSSKFIDLGIMKLSDEHIIGQNYGIIFRGN